MRDKISDSETPIGGANGRLAMMVAIGFFVLWAGAVFVHYRNVSKIAQELSSDQVAWIASQTAQELSRLVSEIGPPPAQSDRRQIQQRYHAIAARLTLYQEGAAAERLMAGKGMQVVIPQLRAALAAREKDLDHFPALEDEQARRLYIELKGFISPLSAAAAEVVIAETNRLGGVWSTAQITLRVIGAATAAVLFAATALLLVLRAQFLALRRNGERNLRLRREAEAGLRAKEDFMAVASHEIRTPLNGVLGMLTALQESGLRQDQQPHARVARSSARTLLSLLNQIIDDARLDQGQFYSDAAPTALGDLLEDVFAVVAPSAWPKGLDLSFVIDQSTPPRVMLDSQRVRQILLNLVSNAVKFTESGGVALRVSVANGGATLRFDVIDSGHGVPARDAEAIFERFRQSDQEAARRSSGSGLGLTIGRKLARALGGDIGMRPREGGGSVFWLEIPLTAAPGGEHPAPLKGMRVAVLHDALTPSVLVERLRALGGEAEALAGLTALAEAPARFDCVVVVGAGALGADVSAVRRHAGDARIAAIRLDAPRPVEDLEIEAGGVMICSAPPELKCIERMAGATEDERAEATAAPRLRGRRFLVSEDQPVNQMVIAMYLQREGAEADLQRDGLAAVEAAMLRPYDGVILDLHTPRMNGDEAARAIRSGDGPNRDAPLIALTADATPRARMALTEAGVVHIATKPLIRESFTDLILNAVGDRPPVDAAQGDAAQPTTDGLMTEDAFKRRALEDFAALGARIDAARKAADAAEGRLAAHALVGSAGALGFADLAELAGLVEEAALEGDEAWAEAAEDLLKMLESTRETIAAQGARPL